MVATLPPDPPGFLIRLRNWPYWPVVGVALAGLVASVVLELTQAYLRPWPVGLLRAVAYLATIGFSVVLTVRRGTATDRARIRAEGVSQLERLLYSTVDTLFPAEDKTTIRSNVMVVKGNQLAIIAGSNMRLWPDREISFGYGVGCCGFAWKQALEAGIDEVSDPTYAPDAQVGTWGLSPDQSRLTKHVLWVLSIPLFTREGNVREFVGVLNLDGVTKRLKEPGRLELNPLLSTLLSVAEQLAKDVRELLSLGT